MRAEASRRCFLSAWAALVTALALPLGASAATAPFASTGAEQEFVVPAGVTSVSVTAVGAPGTRRPFGIVTGTPGQAAQVTGTLAVTPGQKLFVQVGEAPTGYAAAFNGGGPGRNQLAYSGAGGGASDVRTVSRAAPGTLTSRLIVAGGSGGAGRDYTGGDAGTTGAAANGTGQNSTCAGRGASLDAAGAGGTSFEGPNGLAGALGQGGEGAFNTSSGGGGGGGLFGGGGGGAGGLGCGGGGGSSLIPPGGGAVLVPITTAPSVEIAYTLPTPAGGGTTTPPAQNTPAGQATPKVKPKLSRLTITPSSFTAANTGPAAIPAAVGGRVSYRLAGDAATVTFTVERAVRGRKGRKRYVRVKGSVSTPGVLGTNRFRFMGRLGSRSLAKGAYRLVAVARSSGGLSSAAVSASFRIS